MKPILFNTEMVRAILEGRKSVTRRVVKPQPIGHAALLGENILPETEEAGAGRVYAFEDGTVTSPPYRPGDILYVRETFATLLYPNGRTRYVYKATDTYPFGETYVAMFRWHPSIHMPKEAARLFLRVTEVRVERLQEITEDDARSEGAAAKIISRNPFEAIPSLERFPSVWESTIKKADLPIYGWAANPWVWVIAFERIDKEAALYDAG